MDRSQALTIFNIPPDSSPEEINEHFENLAFAVYSPLFIQDPVPSLAKSKIRKLLHLQEGWNIFNGYPAYVKKNETEFNDAADVIQQLELYRSHLSHLRSGLSKVRFPCEAADIIEQMLKVRLFWDEYWVIFSESLSDEQMEEAGKSVKLSENVNVTEMMRILAVVEKDPQGKFNLANLSNSQLELLVRERVKSIRILNNAKLNE